MQSRAQVFASLLAAAFVLATPALALAPDTSTTGTIEFTGGGVAVGVGVGWGHGTLHFRGQDYKLKTSGLSAVDIGVSRYSASGTVTGLNQASDIVGVFQAAELGATVAGGGAVLSMKNDKGVRIKANSTTRGLRFTAAPKGVKIELAK